MAAALGAPPPTLSAVGPLASPSAIRLGALPPGAFARSAASRSKVFTLAERPSFSRRGASRSTSAAPSAAPSHGRRPVR